MYLTKLVEEETRIIVHHLYIIATLSVSRNYVEYINNTDRFLTADDYCKRSRSNRCARVCRILFAKVVSRMLGIMFTVLIHFWFHAEHYTPTAGRKSKFWSLVWTWLFGAYYLFCQIMLAINDTSLDTLDAFCNDLPWSFLLNTNHCTQAHQKFNL